MRRLIILTCALLLAGCTTYVPRTTPAPPSRVFDHEAFARVLAEHVDRQGRVDYDALARDDADLLAYFGEVAAASPASHPELFPTRAHELAYWINAYNATAIVYVLEHLDRNGRFESVMDVRAPRALFFFPEGSGFFFFLRSEYGGEEMSLYSLEHEVVIEGYGDPRAHFALNCASAGCPHLPRAPFRGQTLDARLDEETRKFLGQERNLRLDTAPDGTTIVHLSSIFEWYEDEFLDWAREHDPESGPSLLDFVRHYGPADVVSQLTGKTRIAFIPYDWSLNRQP